MFDDITAADALGYAKAFDVKGSSLDDFDSGFSDLYTMFREYMQHSKDSTGFHDVLCVEFAVHLNFLSVIRAQTLLADSKLDQAMIDCEIYVPEDREIADPEATRFDAYHSLLMLRLELQQFFEPSKLGIINSNDAVLKINAAFKVLDMPEMPMFSGDMDVDQELYGDLRDQIANIEAEDSFVSANNWGLE